MSGNGEWRPATAALGAASAAAFANGRALAVFFAQTGWASWPGVALAAIAFGLAMGATAKLARRAGASGFAALCRRLLGRRRARVVGLFHALLLAVLAAVALLNAGEAGALTLPVRRGFLWGMGLALALAAPLCLSQRRTLPWAGLVLLIAGVAFYGGLALDPRPPRLYLRAEAVLALAGSLPAAAALALCGASLYACASADAVCRCAGEGARPARVAVLCGAALALPLLAGNAALARGGPLLLSMALPTVPLAARWGLVGFWICAGFGFLCDAVTLSAALRGLLGWFRSKSGNYVLNVENRR